MVEYVVVASKVFARGGSKTVYLVLSILGYCSMEYVGIV